MSRLTCFACTLTINDQGTMKRMPNLFVEEQGMTILAELKTDAGQVIGVIVAQPKNFKTGSRGYYAQSKLEIDGKRYQAQIQLVEIGSKEAAKSGA